MTVLNTRVDADLTNFPVYVNLNLLPAGFHTNVNATDARDIRVTTSDGITECPREIVFYTAATDTGEMYFKAPTLANATDTDFYIYYGNAGASEPAVTDTYGRNNTWNSDYKCVLHLNESPNNTANGYVDSTGNVHHGTGTSMAASSAGKVGALSQDFDGNLDSINVANHADLNPTVQLAIMCWINPDLWTSGNRRVWQKGSGDEQYRLCNEDTAGTEFLRLDFDGLDTGHEIDQTPPPTVANWHHMVATYNGSTLKLWDNGTTVASSSPSGTGLDTSTGQLSLAAKNGGSGGDNFDGKMDEFRMMINGRADGWVTTEYNNMNSPSTFFTIGAHEEPPIKKMLFLNQAVKRSSHY